ncbi:MAG: hypothetical protein EOP84_05130 [Verrucomicrobiaceae bacterium]|nr:MAG: hypothetical protein EOP84_05130 [Verrucomicrobiaceae bacterium]
MKSPRLILALAVLLAAVAPITAQVPQILNYQGRISVGTAPFTGTGQFRFALVNGDGTTTYWSNDGTSSAGGSPTAAVALPVVNGLYMVPLGDTTISGMLPVPATVFANGDVRLRVWFDDGTANGSQLLSPDQRIAAVGYAMMAGTVPDGSITAAKIATGQTLATDISGNAATATIAANAATLQTQIGSLGSINQAGNPVDWSQLKNVPEPVAAQNFNDPTRVLRTGDTMSGPLSMGGNKITSVGTPSAATDAATKGYVDQQTQAGMFVSKAGDTMTGALSAPNFSGGGSGLMNLNGAALQAGTVPVGALSSGAAAKFDRQMVSAATGLYNVPVTSNALMDVPGATLTTKNLGSSGTYLIHFGVSESRSAGGMYHYYILNIDGVDVPESTYWATNPGNGTWIPVSMSFRATGLTAGQVIKVRMWSGAGGTCSFISVRLVIDGVQTSQVAP